MSTFLFTGSFVDDEGIPQHGRVKVTPSILPLYNPDNEMVAWEPFIGKIDKGILTMRLPARDSTPTFFFIIEARMNSGRQYYFAMAPAEPDVLVDFDEAYATAIGPALGVPYAPLEALDGVESRVIGLEGQVAGKANTADVNAALALKANASSLAAKADATRVDSLETLTTSGRLSDPSLTATFARPAAIIRSTASMSSWLDKVAAVRLGTSSHAKAVCIGDSTTLGVFNGATLSSSYPTALKRRLGLSLPVQDGLAIALPPSTIGMDSRYAPGGYSYSSGAGPAGASWVASPGAGSDLTFTPTGNVDTIDVWTYNTSSRGTIAVKIDGAAVASINCAVGNGWTRNTYTVTAGAHTIALAKPTVADVYILGVDAYLSTVRSVRVANWGVSGSATGNWTNDAGGIFSLSAITAYAPDLSVIMLGINDAAAPVSAATYGTRLSTLIDTCKATGSVVLVSPIQSNPATGRVDDEQAYRDKMYELAASKDVPLIDAFNLYGAYSTSEGLWADDLHLTAKGYARLGRMVYNGLMAV